MQILYTQIIKGVQNMDKLRYKKINDFIQDLNTREKQYIIKKLQTDILKDFAFQVDFTVNGAKI